MSELTFFVGKGGVGKTTLSAAFAVHLASASRKSKVLLVSTDPAHSLGDVLGKKLGNRPTAALGKGAPRLTVWQIDSEKLFRNFLRERRDELVRTIERGSLFMRDEISALLDSALPGLAEIAALLAIHDAMRSGWYSSIVVDTAPFGHTLRLFGLPEQFTKLSDLLEIAGERDQVLATHFGGTTLPPESVVVQDWRTSLESVRASFREAKLILVTTAERFALNESSRCLRELQTSDHSMDLDAVVLNRVSGARGECPACRRRFQEGRQAQRWLRKEFPKAKFYVAEDPGFPIVGVPQLKALGDSVFGKRRRKLQPPRRTVQTRLPSLTRATWPVVHNPLTFVLGKGGVGKTTTSAALAYHSRQHSEAAVEICSVDPAPSLDDVFEADIGHEPRPVLGDPGLRASELDSVSLFRDWIAEILAEVETATSGESSGIHVDLSYERRLFSKLLDIVPPGLDEVLAIFQIVEMARANGQVIIDMAPTAHALELLRMPQKVLTWSRLLLKSLASHRKLALAREAAAKIAELEVRARELSQIFAGAEAAVYVVMLPEPLPDRETGRLLEELGKLKLAPEAVFVNRVILSEDAGRCARCREQGAWQAALLAGLKRRLKLKTVYVLPEFDHELAGKRGLRELTTSIWQLA